MYSIYLIEATMCYVILFSPFWFCETPTRYCNRICTFPLTSSPFDAPCRHPCGAFFRSTRLQPHANFRMSKRLVGAVDEYDGDRFFTRMGGKGKTVATPLLVCLVCIELSDFVFAVDSIPAVLGVSQVKA